MASGFARLIIGSGSAKTLRFSISSQELIDSDKDRDKFPAELLAAESTLPKAQAYHGYEFKIIDISENGARADYVVFAVRIDYPKGGAESFLMDSNGNIYTKDLGAEPWVALKDFKRRDDSWDKYDSVKRAILWKGGTGDFDWELDRD